MIGLITPPVGLCLYIVSRYREESIIRVASELVPFYVALIVCLALITLFRRS